MGGAREGNSRENSRAESSQEQLKVRGWLLQGGAGGCPAAWPNRCYLSREQERTPRLAGNAPELQEVRLLFQLPGTEQKWLNTQ